MYAGPAQPLSQWQAEELDYLDHDLYDLPQGVRAKH